MFMEMKVGRPNGLELKLMQQRKTEMKVNGELRHITSAKKSHCQMPGW